MTQRINQLIRKMENAPDFGYDDESVELTKILTPLGKKWRWNHRDKVEIIKL